MRYMQQLTKYTQHSAYSLQSKCTRLIKYDFWGGVSPCGPILVLGVGLPQAVRALEGLNGRELASRL